MPKKYVIPARSGIWVGATCYRAGDEEAFVKAAGRKRVAALVASGRLHEVEEPEAPKATTRKTAKKKDAESDE